MYTYLNTTQSGPNYNYHIPIRMTTDSSLTSDQYIQKLRPTIAFHRVAGSGLEDLLHSVNYLNHSDYHLGSTTTLYQETWYIPHMNELYYNQAGVISSAGAQSGSVVVSSATSGHMQMPFAFYFNQATGSPTFIRNAINGLSVNSSYRLCTFSTADTLGWASNSSNWSLCSGSSYTKLPCAIKIDLKDLYQKLQAQYSTSKYAYVSMDFVGVVLKSYDARHFDNSAGIQLLLTERTMQTYGGTIKNYVYGGDTDTSWNVGFGNFVPFFKDNNNRVAFSSHVLLLAAQVGTTISNLSEWTLYCTPVIPTIDTHTTTTDSSFGIQRPCIRVSVSLSN